MIKTILIMAVIAGFITGLLTGHLSSGIAMFIISKIMGFLIWGALELLKQLMK